MFIFMEITQLTNVTSKPNPELYAKSREFLKDGKIDAKELSQLTKIAEKDGINSQEQKFLNSLTNKQNVKEIKTGKSETVEMIFPDKNKDYKDLMAIVTDKKSLETLYKSGKLDQKDSKGKTVLENIKEMTTSKMQTGVDGKKLANETIAILADRNQIKQGPHGTCGAGSVQNFLWNKDPAEMIRMVKDIAKDGKVTLRDGKEMTAGTKSLTWHEGDKIKDGSIENRSDFNIIFQSAVMKDQSFLGDYTDYNVQNDTGDGKAVLTGDSASDPYKVKNLLQSVTGEHYDNNMFDFETLKERVNQGKEVIACYFPDDSEMGMHYVTILEVKDGKVKFQNTQSGTLDEMSEEEFKNKILATISKNDSKTGNLKDVSGFTDQAISAIPLALGVTAFITPVALPVIAPPLIGLYAYKKGKDLIQHLPERLKQSAVDANITIKKNEWFKDEKGNAQTAKQNIKTVEKETEARVLKNTSNKTAAKVAGKTAGAMQSVVSTAAVGAVMVSNKIKDTGEGIQQFSRSANGMAKVTNHRANVKLKEAQAEGITKTEKLKKQAMGYSLKVVSKASAATGYVTQKAGKAVTYVGGKIEKATGAIVKTSQPVIKAVSNTVGNIYAGASSAASTVKSWISW